MVESDFCYMHQTLSPEQIKKRWINKYILGLDGTGFFFAYTKKRAEKIHADLASGFIRLDQRDIDLIPAQDKYIDIYVLLCSIGVATPQLNKKLYIKTLHYFFRTSAAALLYNNIVINQKIKEHIILKSPETLEHFLLNIPLLYKLQAQIFLVNQYLFPSIVQFVNSILDSDVMKVYSWIPHREILHNSVVKELGPSHPMTIYYESRLLPDLQELYSTEKQIKKAKIFCIQEDLMAKTWHPGRFQEWCIDEEEKKEDADLL